MKSFIRILSFSKPYSVTVILAFIASIFYGLFNAISLWVVGSLIGTIMGAGDAANSTTISNSNNLINKLGYYFEQILDNATQVEKLKIVCICLFVSFSSPL